MLSNFKQLFKRENQEEITPCDTVNSWILENGIVHYCPICDILEYCKNGKDPDCDFHSSYGVHFDCLPSLFGVPFLKLDDPVGAISAHGVVGILGVMVVPLTSDASFVDQATGVLSIAGFTFLASLGTILVINKFMPIRATDEEQYVGLDSSEIGVEAYPEF